MSKSSFLEVMAMIMVTVTVMVMVRVRVRVRVSVTLQDQDQDEEQGQDHMVWVCTLARHRHLNRYQRDLPRYQEGPFCCEQEREVEVQVEVPLPEARGFDSWQTGVKNRDISESRGHF
jgi:hypothetical protein